MVETGATPIAEPVNPPGNQVYVTAPEPIKAAILPGHKIGGLLVIVNVGLETRTDIVLVLGQPIAFTPVTV